MRKPAFCICENKDADQRLCFHISFRYMIAQSLYFLNTKFQAPCHLVRLNSLVCVGPGRKPRRPVFSQRGSEHNLREIQQDDNGTFCFKPLVKPTMCVSKSTATDQSTLLHTAKRQIQFCCDIVHVFVKAYFLQAFVLNFA